MKVCTVPEEWFRLCPDPRIFNACVNSLLGCRSEEEVKRVLERCNKLCEVLKCPYLKEVSRHP